MKRYRLLLAVFLILLIGGCNDAPAGTVVVEGAWGRPSPQGAPTTAFYMTIENSSSQDDVLLEVRINNCETVEIHRTSIDEGGVMRMAPVAGGQIVVAAGESVILAPGDLHLMCIGLAQPFTGGQQVPLTAVFADSGDIAVTAEIRQEAP
jgi:copper(I)-binding protein